jgi:hypothetical protein
MAFDAVKVEGDAGRVGSYRRGLAPKRWTKGQGRPKAARDRTALALQPGKVRRSLGGFRRGGEDRLLVFLHDGKPDEHLRPFRCHRA